MEKKENKKISWDKKGGLTIVVDSTQPLFLPLPDQTKKEIGIYSQKTMQIIDKKNVPDLQNFIISQKKQIEDQITSTKDKLEQLKNVKEGLIPKTELKAIRQVMKQNKEKFDAKPFAHLSRYIKNLDMKMSHQINLESLHKQMEQVESDYKEICEGKIQ